MWDFSEVLDACCSPVRSAHLFHDCGREWWWCREKEVPPQGKFEHYQRAEECQEKTGQETQSFSWDGGGSHLPVFEESVSVGCRAVETYVQKGKRRGGMDFSVLPVRWVWLYRWRGDCVLSMQEFIVCILGGERSHFSK